MEENLSNECIKYMSYSIKRKIVEVKDSLACYSSNDKNILLN